jgi:hypothetical protein
MHLVKVQQLETSNIESSRASSMPSIHRATSPVPNPRTQPVPNPRTQPVPNPRTQVASAGESALARAQNYLNSKLDRFDSFLIGCIFVLAFVWASALAIDLLYFGNFTSQQALMDREDTAIVLGPFLQTLKSTPAFMREEVAVMRQEGDLAMMAENWLAAASYIDEVLQVSSAMRP